MMLAIKWLLYPIVGLLVAIFIWRVFTFWYSYHMTPEEEFGLLPKQGKREYTVGKWIEWAALAVGALVVLTALGAGVEWVLRQLLA